MDELPGWDYGEDFRPAVRVAEGHTAAEKLVRMRAKALAEVCLRAYVTDCWILHDADSEDDDFCLTQPWYELPRMLPVSEEALMAIISGSSAPDWDMDVAALAEYIAAAVIGAC